MEDFLSDFQSDLKLLWNRAKGDIYLVCFELSSRPLDFPLVFHFIWVIVAAVALVIVVLSVAPFDRFDDAHSRAVDGCRAIVTGKGLVVVERSVSLEYEVVVVLSVELQEALFRRVDDLREM